MPNKKITAMPSLAGNQVPTDLVTAVDLSATPTQQNVKSTLNDLFATITKNITDRAIRFQAPGSAPAVSSASQGALYHDGTAFLASSNGGAYEPLYTLSAQSAALVFAGPTSGPAATPTFRALALTDLPTLATASLVGRSSAGTGTPEQISSTAALLTWLQNPISANLSAAVTDSTGAGGALVFGFNPVLTNPRFNSIAADPSGSGSNLLFTPSVGAVNHLEILNATAGNGPTIRPTGLSANQPLNLSSRGTGIVSITGNQLRVTGNTAAAAGIVELRGGNSSLSGGQIRFYEVSTNGTNYVGFQAPDILASNLLFELPATDGTSGQVLRTDGAGILSFASYLPSNNPAATGAMTVTNTGNVVPLTITNSGTANTLVVEDVGADLSPFVIAADGRVIVGALTGNLFDSFTIGGTLLSASNASVANVVRATIPSTSTSAGASFASAISTVAAAFTLATLEHFVAIQGTFAAPSVVTQQFGFSARSSMTGGSQNYGFFSAVPAGATNWSFFSGAGAANSRFAGQVLHESGSAAAPSMTFDGDLNTGLAQIGGADNISITTGGTERLRAKSGGAIRFIPLTAAPGSPEAGDVFYNSTTNKLQVYNGTTWQDCN